MRCRAALEDGRPLRALQLDADDAKRLRGFQFLSAKPLLLVLNLDEADLPRADDAVALAGHRGIHVGRGDARRADLREDRARDRAARSRRRRRVPRRSRAARVGPRSRDPRQLRPARLHLVFHRRRRRVPRVVDPAKHAGGARRRRDSQRHLARLHPRRGRAATTTSSPAARSPPAASTASCASKARTTSCSTATASTSGMRHRRGARFIGFTGSKVMSRS